MQLFKNIYERISGKQAPYYLDYSLLTIGIKPLRKFVAQVLTPNCPFNFIRIALYRMCGFKIGRHVFIGMKCYLDDMCYDLLTIGDNCTISYGVYFACHGKNQEHLPIRIKDGAYIGMRAIILSKTEEENGLTVGAHAVVGAGSLIDKNIPDYATAVGVPCRIIENQR